MAARHRLREPPPDPAPVKRLVCNSLAMGTQAPSVIRECLEPTQHGICHTQVWVSMTQLPAVETGELRPVCPDCHENTGHHVTLHHLTVTELTRRGELEQGWEVIGEMNEGLTRRKP